MEKGKILIVDDEPESREAIKLYLTGEHYHFIEAENGEEAVKKLESGDNLVNLGLILCDINMPKVDGVQAMQYIRRNAPGIPIVAITGHPDMDTAKKLLHDGVKDYLIKPVNGEKLRTTVKNLIMAGKDIEF